MGGNKARHLEFYLGDARQQGADTILITGAVQSNYVALRQHGAREVHVCATHAVLCGPAKERLDAAPIDSVIAASL